MEKISIDEQTDILTTHHAELLELITSFEELLEVFPDEVDAVPQQSVDTELVGKLQDANTVGEIQVPNLVKSAAVNLSVTYLTINSTHLVLRSRICK